MNVYDEIVKNIPHGRDVKSTWLHPHGGLVLSANEGRVLTYYFRKLYGIHIDIGTYFGGSAILAALTKPDGKVITIDSQCTGHWSSKLITQEKVIENFREFNVENRIILVRAFSHPFPVWFEPGPTSIFIDGSEDDTLSDGGVLHDWENSRLFATQYIFFHDCRDEYPGVMRTVKKAKEDPFWRFVGLYDSLAVFKRNPYL